MTPATSPRFDDAAARQRIRTSLDESLIVEAAAGTGKTSELVRRIVAVLQQGTTTVDKIVAVTFTHKAAGELKLRLRVGLDVSRAKATPQAAAHLEHALAHLEEASIGTIHSFCAQLLRERPVEAEVDPSFTELSDSEQRRLYGRAFRSWMEHRLGLDSPGLRRALSRLSHRDAWDQSPPASQLEWAGRTLIEWRDFPGYWQRKPWDRESAIEDLVERSRQIAPRLQVSQALRPIHDFALWLERAEWLERRDFDTLESLLLKLRRDLNKPAAKRGQIDDLYGRLEAFHRESDADFAAALREDMLDLVDRYGDLKRKTGKLDFLDLLILARNLVRGRRDVRHYLQRRYSHIFVDEFQDTDPLQAELLLLLAADDPDEDDWTQVAPVPGKLFAVGDPKQSIYKFRRADVVLYHAVRDRLVARGAGLVHLTRSWRSVGPIQECVNAAFAPEMTGEPDSGQAGYVPLEGGAAQPDAQPAIVAIPAPKPYATRRIAKSAIDACLPDTIAAFTAWLIRDSGWTVREGAGRVPVSPRHVCVLFRRFTNFGTDLTREYARGLEARGVPHVLVGSKSFHNREEVETVRTALTAIEWPEDELSVYATLRGALFGFEDAILFRYLHEVGSMHPRFHAPEDLTGEFAAIRDALTLLRDLHRERNERPVAVTVNLLLDAVRAHAGFALRPHGQQVLANVLRAADLARQFEMSGGISFRGFVEELVAQAERTEGSEAPVLEEGAEGVRLMTVHAAKGLEFPVVILADLTANLSAAEPERYVDPSRELCATRLLRCAPWELLEHEAEEKKRENAEGVRVAYVAATRARDLLAVPVVGDQEMAGSWLAPLHKAVYPPFPDWRRPRTAPGCPPFGGVSVLDRPPEYLTASGDPSVKPGLHQPLEGAHSVVWWDPASLELGVEAEFGVDQGELLAPDGVSERSEEDYRRWLEARAAAIAKGSAPTFDVFAPTDGRPLPDGFAAPVELVAVDHPPGRPTGRRFGSLVHGALRDVDFAESREGIERSVALRARVLGASREESEAAIQTVERVLAHPLLRRARVARRSHREWPVTMKLDGGAILEGAIDLAFEEDGAWHIVDFKTDDALGYLKKYRTQVQWYALAVTRATGLPASVTLLAV